MFFKKKKEQGVKEESMAQDIKEEDVVELLTSAIEEALKKNKQELIAQDEEGLAHCIRKYRSQVARRAWKTAQKWCKWSDDDGGPVLMPDKARLYYRRGNTEVVVQEIAPTTRNLRFEKALALKSNSEDDSVGESADVMSYTLALPYINFIYRFINGVLDRVQVSFCDRPLKNLQEKPLKPYFSNVNNDLKVCHGQSFDTSKLEKGNLTQQISYTLDMFWQTVFKDEWSQNFWDAKRWFADRDERMTSLEKWQEASLDNPLFVIEDVEWEEYNEPNYGVMLVRLFDQDSEDAKFQQELFDDLTEAFTDEVVEELTQKHKSIAETVSANLDLQKMASEFVAKIKGTTT